MLVQRRSRIVGSSLVAIAAMALAGCGGGAGSSNSPGSTNSASTAPTQSSAVAVPALAKMLPKQVADSKTLVIGVALGSPPDEYMDENNNIVGWEIDIVRAASDTFGLELKLKPDSFDSLIPGLQANKYNAAIGQFGVTGDREKVVDFVTTLQSNELFAARSDSDIKVNSLDDLCGLTVATTRGSREYEFAKAHNPKCKTDGKPPIDIKVFNDSNQAGLSLTSKRSDLFWLGATAISYFVEKTNGQTKVVGSYLKPNPLGIALTKDSGMAKPMQAAVQHIIDDGTYAKILKKWGLTDAGIKESQVNPKVTAG